MESPHHYWEISSGKLFSNLAYVKMESNKNNGMNKTTDKSVSTRAGTVKQKACSLLSPLHWREIIRQLISGDKIRSKLLITFTLLCNITYIILAVIHMYSLIEECFELSESPDLICGTHTGVIPPHFYLHVFLCCRYTHLLLAEPPHYNQCIHTATHLCFHCVRAGLAGSSHSAFHLVDSTSSHHSIHPHHFTGCH